MNDWLEAEQRVERAQQLSESQRWEEALAEIDVALSINPNNASWHANRGYLLEELDRWEDAAAAYQVSYDLDPGDRDVGVALGASLAGLRRFSQALQVFESLSQSHPDFEPAYCHRIGIYAELDRHDQAEEMFYLAQELDEDCPHCFYHMGTSLAARKRFDRAVFCWRRVLDLCPDYIGVNRLIAQAYRAQGRLDEAKECYLCEVRSDPGNTDLLYELAEMIVESGDLAAAGAKFAQIIELDPSNVEAHFALGRLWLLRDQPERALACFDTVRSIDGENSGLDSIGIKTGEALIRLGRFAEAQEEFERAVETHPTSIGALMLLGNCRLMMRKTSGAADAFRRVLAQDADHALAHHRLAVCLVLQGMYAAGLDHCRHALRTRPDFEAATYTAVMALLHLAQWREARSVLRAALRRNPHDLALRQLNQRFWYYRVRYYLRATRDVVARILGRPR